MKKILMFCIKFYRNVRSTFSTYVLRMIAKKSGKNVYAARMPHIGSQVILEIGSHASFNGFTATGVGGQKLVIISIRAQM